MPEMPPGPEIGGTRSLGQRRAWLLAALQTLRDQPTSPPDAKLAGWLNTWKGLGTIVDGMAA